MSTSPIDLSGGFVPNQPQAQSQPGSIDLSGGFVPNEQPQPGAAYRFGAGLGREVNPAAVATGFRDMAAHPIDSALADAHARGEVFNKAGSDVDQAKKEWDDGRYFKALDTLGGAGARYLYSMIPGVGPRINQAGEKFAAGDFAGGAGQSIGIGLMMAAPGLLKEASPGAMIAKAGQKLTDYAPQIASDVHEIAPVGGALGGGVPGYVAARVLRQPMEAVATGAAKGAGAGLKWVGNLLSADASGIQPLPMTKAIIRQAGLSPSHFLESEGIEGEPPEVGANTNNFRPGTPSPSKVPQGGPLTSTAQIANNVFQKVQEAEANGNIKPSEKPMSIMFEQDRPYFEAAQKQLGQQATTDQIGQLARQLKGNDEYLSGVLKRSADPRTMSGEAALTQTLTALGRDNLLKIAKSRGLNVTQESQLVASSADPKLIRKIADSMSPDELDEISARYMQAKRFGHKFDTENLSPEDASKVWQTIHMQDYFPDVKVTQAAQKLVQKAAGQPQAPSAPQTVGTAAGAQTDTALFQQARQKLGPNASVSDIAKEAQAMKTAGQSPDLGAQLRFMNQARQQLGATATLRQVTQKAQELQRMAMAAQ